MDDSSTECDVSDLSVGMASKPEDSKSKDDSRVDGPSSVSSNSSSELFRSRTIVSCGNVSESESGNCGCHHDVRCSLSGESVSGVDGFSKSEDSSRSIGEPLHGPSVEGIISGPEDSSLPAGSRNRVLFDFDEVVGSKLRVSSPGIVRSCSLPMESDSTVGGAASDFGELRKLSGSFVEIARVGTDFLLESEDTSELSGSGICIGSAGESESTNPGRIIDAAGTLFGKSLTAALEVNSEFEEPPSELGIRANNLSAFFSLTPTAGKIDSLDDAPSEIEVTLVSDEADAAVEPKSGC